MSRDIVVPIALNKTNTCTVTPKWFVNDAEYYLLPGKFKLLTNGEETFGAVYDAIAGAQKSVSIICWGFQPSMYFKRGVTGYGLRIGELLEARAIAGVKVRVLSWALEVNIGIARVSVEGLAEANLTGRRAFSVNDCPPTMRPDAFKYSKEWFMRYDKGQGFVDKHLRSGDGKAKTENIEFVSRGFSAGDRVGIATSDREDKGTSTTTRTAQAVAPSHHQKVVIVDFEDPERAVAFVMGHNTLDEYWDSSAHSHTRFDDPRFGRNSTRPRQDISSCVRGPLLGDLFHNFNSAWKKETKKDLTEGIDKLVFERYPLSGITRQKEEEETEALRKELAKATEKGDTARAAELEQQLAAPRAQAQAVGLDGEAIMGQILRTQAQCDVRDIQKGYLQALNNATQCIYIENQYFRWPPLAERIKEAAQGHTGNGRKPEEHGPLYLFAITNADKEGLGAGTVSTARMLESLGRGDVLPEVCRDEQIKDTEAELKQAEQESMTEKAEQQKIKSNMGSSSTDRQHAQKEIDASKERQDAADQRAEKLKADLDAQREDKEKEDKESRTAISPKPRPGLKVHVGTLIAPDSPGRSGTTTTSEGSDQRALTRDERIDVLKKKIKEKDGAIAGANTGLSEGTSDTLKKERAALVKELKDLEDRGSTIDWIDVYVHAKLMIIDDTFMTLGSANINSRSMETDSELNITHANHLISQPARKALWQLHTNSVSGGEELNSEGMKSAYDNWERIMAGNKKNRLYEQAPIASLVEFFSGTEDRSNID